MEFWWSSWAYERATALEIITRSDWCGHKSAVAQIFVQFLTGKTLLHRVTLLDYTVLSQDIVGWDELVLTRLGY
jgi:hypothetical protein